MKWTITLVFYFSFFPLLLAEEMSSISFNSSKWQQLKFKSINSNQVEFLKDSLLIKVNNSASPLIYPLEDSKKLSQLNLELEVNGSLKLGKELQGAKKNDDFLFRIGLVYEGDKTLNFLQKMMAPNWIKTLYSLSKGQSGIENVVFYNVYSDDRLAKKTTRPSSI
jgi:hypothetical protein